MKTLVLGLDIDGVQADYESAFRHKVAQYLGVDPATIGPQTDWSFVRSGWPIRSDEHFRTLHAAAVRDGMFRQMDEIPGASRAIWAMSDAGVHVRIVTHRLCAKGTHAAAGTDTILWLDEHNIPYRDLTFVADKPAVLADVYVDDAPHNVEALRAAGAYVICFDQLYNRHVPGPRARDWSEVVELVAEYAKANGFAYDESAVRSDPPALTALVP